MGGQPPAGVRRRVSVFITGVLLVIGGRGLAAEGLGPSDVHALLDVPYLSQTPELCGGAALAMVLRYWGERDVFAQDFAALVGPGDGGIVTGVLAAAVRGRGWQALVMPAGEDAGRASIRSDIDRGRPLIALIEVAPHTYHYVVIVGSTDQEVVLHDPARAPFRVVDWAEFDRAWAATGRWSLLVLPPSGLEPRRSPALPTVASRNPATLAPATACGAMVESGVQMALAGDGDGAGQELTAATRVCPTDAASWRELAGLRFSQSRFAESRDLALSATRLAPHDAYAWQLLATSRYLLGDATGALAAWNRTGEPRIDVTDIHGAGRTRQPVIARAAGLQPRQILTPEAFGLALRRLRDLPVASGAQMKYEPLDGGLAKVDLFVDERAVAPAGLVPLAALGARALLYDELRVEIAGPLGAGELDTVAWRWSARRPRVAFGLALPSSHLLAGVVSFEGSWERQSYDTGPSTSGATTVVEPRRRVDVHVSDWSTSHVRWQAGAALDRLHAYEPGGANLAGARDYFSADGTIDVRLSGDRVALSASAGWWTPFAGGAGFGTGAILGAWRSTIDPARAVWSATAEASVASAVAPLALWQGAGVGQGRAGLLRAHPLLAADLVSGPVFGRGLAHGTFEYSRPIVRAMTGGLSIAGFVDTARAWRGLAGSEPSRLYIDAGIGLRVRAPGRGAVVRVDVAHGLRGGGTTLSAGWSGAWPR